MDKIEMSERDILILKIKNLAIDPIDYANSKELLKLMDYYGVNGLMDISIDQLKEYYERATSSIKTRTTRSSR